MRQITKILLLLLSYAPIATVAVAAQAKASEIEGEEQNAVLLKAARAARFRLMPDGHMAISYENAQKRYAELTGLKGNDLSKSMAVDLQTLIDRGAIQLDEKGMVSAGPSQFAL
jgi:hypothetical protein